METHEHKYKPQKHKTKYVWHKYVTVTHAESQKFSGMLPLLTESS